jgi:hypothetical protein
MLYFIFFYYILFCAFVLILPGQMQNIETNKGNNKITELRTILQRESQNS